MNKELVTRTEGEPIRQVSLWEGLRGTTKYTNANYFARGEATQLERVRRELATFPIINIIVPGKPAEAAQQEPETMGEAFLDLLFGFIGLALSKTGDLVESLGDKK
jgi:hypothetical protein